jgi:hypothetical protein
VRQASLLVEFDDGGLGIGPQLGGGGAEGVGRLQGMATLDAAVTLGALTDVDVELALNGPAGDLDLELLGDVRRAIRPKRGTLRLADPTRDRTAAEPKDVAFPPPEVIFRSLPRPFVQEDMHVFSRKLSSRPSIA